MASATGNSAAVELVLRNGDQETLSYEKLVAIDGDGKSLRALMEATEGGFQIAYRDAGARYPVTVDPLIVNQSLPISIIFQPVGGSGTRNAILQITSNDADTSVYAVNLSGFGMSNTDDGDNDGMNDWAEYALWKFGFDWQVPQQAPVSEYYVLAPEAGLVTLDGVASLHAGASLLKVNSATQRAAFAISIQQSADLDAPFTPILANPTQISVDTQGRIVYEVDAPIEKRFYRMEVGP